MYLDRNLVGIVTSMSRESTSMSKNPRSIGINEKSTNCSTLTNCLTFCSFFVVLLSTYSSSSKSLIITNVDAGGENCL
jgi:hypothetical protein